MRGEWKAALIGALAAAWFACGGGGPEGVRSRGVVEAVDGVARTVTLDHEEIPGLMAAMTMQFRVAPGVELDEVEPGATVEFWVKEEGGRYTVTGIRREGS